jgi:hypothetical protein
MNMNSEETQFSGYVTTLLLTLLVPIYNFLSEALQSL